ncbi:MAG: ComEC/Rec2 family competence protein, partial [Chloroflexi bacterium]|nr:ComEC/Rec2 family competence protein [Chloroflexota bacterium]
MRLTLACGAGVAGVALGLAWDLPLAALGLFLLAALCLLSLAWLNRWPMLLPFAAVLLVVGAVRGETGNARAGGLEPWIGLEGVLVEGVVTRAPEKRGTAVRFPLQVRRVYWDGAWVEGKGEVLVTATPPATLARERREPYLRYGDLLRLEGALLLPPASGDFDYREYLARQGILALMKRPEVAFRGAGYGSPGKALLFKARLSLAASLEDALPEPQSSLAQALLMGLRANMPDDVTQAFQDTGTTHLLAVSGMNVGMVLLMALPVSAFLLGRRRGLYLLLPLLLLWLYAALSALSPSVVRAAIMASVYLLALALGRPRAVLPSMGLAAALMVAQQPLILYDLSFQLSFAAVAGIVALWRPMAALLELALGRMLQTERWPRPLRTWLIDGTAASVAAVVATAPILAFNFHRLALLSVPATLVVLPVVPYLLVASFFTAVAGLAFATLGQLVGWSALMPLSYMVWVVKGLARLPHAVVQLGAMSGLLVAAYYGLFALVVLSVQGVRGQLRWRRQREAPSSAVKRELPASHLWGLLSLGLAGATVWFAVATLPDGRLHLTFLDVGQGDALLLQTPEGQRVLIDGGPSPQLMASKLGRHVPFWDRTLEMVVLTHAHEDHLAGLLEALRRYKVAAVLDTPYRQGATALLGRWEALEQEEGAAVVLAEAGQRVRLGEGVTLEVLGPPRPLMGGTESDINNNSTVLLLRYGDFTALLPGDLALEGEALLVEEGAP